MIDRDDRKAPQGAIDDRPARVEVSVPRRIGDGFRPYDRFEIAIEGADGAPQSHTRDILRVGPVVALLPVDLDAGCFVLIRQFRLAAHLATGRGDIVELVAGRVDEGEDLEAAARRECVEEIGVAPTAMRPILSFMPTPGVTDEDATIYLALVDSSRVPPEAGAAQEAERTQPFTIAIDDALAALEAGAPGNVFLIAALQWFALHRDRIAQMLGDSA